MMMNFQPKEHHKYLFGKIKPSFKWDGAAPSPEIKAKYRAKLSELLGIDTFEKCDPKLEILHDRELSGNRCISFAVQTEENYFANCHLMMPKDADTPLPLCVCLQGHVSGAHLSIGIEKFPYDDVYLGEEELDFCIQAVRNGYIALAIEQRCFGENGGNPENGATQCWHPSYVAVMMGRTVIGERVWDVQRVLDAMETDFAELFTYEGSVLMGMSGGGTATYYTACLEDRISGFLSSVAVCSFYESIVSIDHCACNYVPSIAKYFDMGDMAVMIAPKHLLMANADSDRYFPKEGSLKAYETVKGIYKSLGAEERCKMIFAEGGHNFHAEENWRELKELMCK